ncbi:uncharacterized protein LOC106139514 [Amyelois transitella]|uniref:uncharacterized protein LOC106139514 n=1 Tax=Amyelois transitella TaxID=680683 RepID=UPI00067C6A28|nr:uncharacterized protein LOC106139514 [Amyelois transitella]
MGEQIMNNQTGDEDMNSSGITFDNLTILKEFSNIADLVRIEDFLETVPKAKLRRVKWIPMFNCLKQAILDEMEQEFSSMWEYENMPAKLAILEKQKEKFAEVDSDKQLWRPQLGDVKAQLKARDIANLQKQKVLLESLAKEYETRVQKLKKIISAKRGYLKALQMDIQKYQRKNEDFIRRIGDKLENHQNLVKVMIPEPVDVSDLTWSDDMDIN